MHKKTIPQSAFTDSPLCTRGCFGAAAGRLLKLFAAVGAEIGHLHAGGQFCAAVGAFKILMLVQGTGNHKQVTKNKRDPEKPVSYKENGGQHHKDTDKKQVPNDDIMAAESFLFISHMCVPF